MTMISFSPRQAGCRGFTLLEVLVALVVLSVGLLGLSGLQTSSLRNNHSAMLRSQATVAAHEIIDRMRTNRDAAIAGDYDIAYADDAPDTCVNRSCANPDDLADADVFAWRSFVVRLPGGQGQLDVDADGIAEVRVRWVDGRDSAVPLEIITRAQL